MSGSSASLAVDIGSNVFSALQASRQAKVQASVSQTAAIASSEAAAQQALAAGAAQSLAFERQAQAAEFQAEQLAQQAKLIRARTALRLAQEGREGRRRQGARRAAFFAPTFSPGAPGRPGVRSPTRGITLRGSPTEVLADAAAEEALGLAILEFKGKTQAALAQQGSEIRGFEAAQLRSEAGFARESAAARASFIRQNATVGLIPPSRAGLSTRDIAISAGLSALPGLTNTIANRIADGPGPFTTSGGGQDLTFRPARRSQISPILLP